MEEAYSLNRKLMEEYLKPFDFWESVVKTETGFMCKHCAKEYEGCDRATITSYTKHIVRGECPGLEISESTRTLFREAYDKKLFDPPSHVQELNDAIDRPSTKYSLRSHTKKTGDSNISPGSRIIQKKKSGVSYMSTLNFPNSINRYAWASPMQNKPDIEKKIDLYFKNFDDQEKRLSALAYRGPNVQRDVAPVIDGALLEMQNMLAVFKSKLDRTHEDRGPDVLHAVAPVIDASFLEMQNKLAVFKDELKSKVDAAILKCPPLLPSPPPPPPIDLYYKNSNDKEKRLSALACGVSVLRDVAPVINDAFTEMKNMLAVFKLKLDRTHEDREPDVLREVAPVIDASFLEMQIKLAVFNGELKMKLCNAIKCPPPPPPIA